MKQKVTITVESWDSDNPGIFNREQISFQTENPISLHEYEDYLHNRLSITIIADGQITDYEKKHLTLKSL